MFLFKVQIWQNILVLTWWPYGWVPANYSGRMASQVGTRSFRWFLVPSCFLHYKGGYRLGLIGQVGVLNGKAGFLLWLGILTSCPWNQSTNIVSTYPELGTVMTAGGGSMGVTNRAVDVSTWIWPLQRLVNLSVRLCLHPIRGLPWSRSCPYSQKEGEKQNWGMHFS